MGIYANRSIHISKKPKLILDKSFPVWSQINVGDGGLLQLDCIIEGERMDTTEDGTDLFVKTLRVKKAEVVKNNTLRISR